MASERIRYHDDDFNEREGEVVERNGSLRYVEQDDGEGEWVSDFQEN